MGREFGKLLVGGAFAGALLISPASAQSGSDGYQFLKAVRDRDGEVVTQKLNEPGSTVVNARDLTSGESALHIVTQRRDLQWIRFLTQRGGNPNVEDKNGVTPLQIASSLGFVDGVEALIKAGANVDKANTAGETPLISAIHRRDVAMARLLLANGASPDRSDNSGRTARDYASLMTGNTQLMEEIAKADEAKEAAGETKTYGPSF